MYFYHQLEEDIVSEELVSLLCDFQLLKMYNLSFNGALTGYRVQGYVGKVVDNCKTVKMICINNDNE